MAASMVRAEKKKFSCAFAKQLSKRNRKMSKSSFRIKPEVIMKKKFKGCLLGSLLGDCLGEPFEFAGATQRQVDDFFDKLEQGILPNRFQKRGSLPYTDDTAMTKVLTKSLIRNRSIDVMDLAAKFSKEYYDDPLRGYGTFVRKVFQRLHEEKPTDVLQPAREQFEGSGSYGNGAAMRVAPVALFHHQNTDLMIDAAVKSSLVTHAHRNGYNGAVLLCLAIQKALLTEPDQPIDPLGFCEELLEKMTRIEKTHETQDFCDSIITMERLLTQNPPPSKSSVIHDLGQTIIALRSVPTAIFCFLLAQKPIAEIQVENQFERTVRYVISLGGDTDTIACMAGGLTGAHLGVDAIPPHLIELCEDNKLVAQLADKLYAKFQCKDQWPTCCV